MRIGFIGTGAMASAIARGAVAAGFSGSDLMFADRHHQAAEDLADELGGVALASNRQVAEQSDLLVLAVKPNVQSEVIREIRESVLCAKELCVISIAAGRTTDQIYSDFGAAVPLVRVMPNVNAQIGQSMSALCPMGTTDEQLAAARKLLDSVGQTIVLDEKYFPVFTAIASSSPAWIFRMIDATIILADVVTRRRQDNLPRPRKFIGAFSLKLTHSISLRTRLKLLLLIHVSFKHTRNLLEYSCFC